VSECVSSRVRGKKYIYIYLPIVVSYVFPCSDLNLLKSSMFAVAVATMVAITADFILSWLLKVDLCFLF
jgi:hypothetical protein